jgi:hypothetical protein
VSVVRKTLRNPLNTLYALSEALWYVVQAIQRPKTRGDCVEGLRPCPWISCKHHMAGDVTRVGSYRVLNADPRLEWRSRSLHPEHPIKAGQLEEIASLALRLADTCVLDVADRGPIIAVAVLLRVHSKSAREAELSAMKKMAMTKGLNDG